MDGTNETFEHLDRFGRLTADAVRSTRLITYLAVLLMTVGAWVFLLAMAARTPPGLSGPGWSLPPVISQLGLPAPLENLLALCLTSSPPGMMDPRAIAALVLMWFLMSIAMMLPSAAPLVRTYCEIADTAKAASKPVVHPLWLVGGYLLVWLGAAVLFAAAGSVVSQLTSSGSLLWPAAAPVSACALALAGLYQFSGLKQACLTKCRNPFATLFANWSDKRLPVFALGVKQGVWCLGCCWALMLVMFAVGVMNIFWMALLALFTVMEKTGGKLALSRTAGVLLLVWALAVILLS